MKEKLKRTMTRKLRLLRLTLKKGERADYVWSQWLREQPDRILLPFEFDGTERGDHLSYDVKGTCTLERFTKAALSTAQYEGLLRSVAHVCETCVEQGIPTANLWFDPAHVFVTPEGEACYVLVPRPAQATTSKRASKHGTPLSLLTWLGDKAHAHMVVREDEAHRHAVADWARRQRVFSPDAFSRFLDQEFEGVPLTRFEGRGEGSHRPPIPADIAGDNVASFDPLTLLGGGEAGYVAQTTAQRIGEVDRALPQEPPAWQHAGHGRDGSDDTSSLGSGSLGASTGEQATAAPLYVMRMRDGLALEVGPGEHNLGRSATCDLHFGGNQNVSRVHARVMRVGEGLRVVDCGAANGTYVHGQRLVPHASALLSRGDVFTLADESFSVR